MAQAHVCMRRSFTKLVIAEYWSHFENSHNKCLENKLTQQMLATTYSVPSNPPTCANFTSKHCWCKTEALIDGANPKFRKGKRRLLPLIIWNFEVQITHPKSLRTCGKSLGLIEISVSTAKVDGTRLSSPSVTKSTFWVKSNLAQAGKAAPEFFFGAVWYSRTPHRIQMCNIL